MCRYGFTTGAILNTYEKNGWNLHLLTHVLLERLRSTPRGTDGYYGLLLAICGLVRDETSVFSDDVAPLLSEVALVLKDAQAPVDVYERLLLAFLTLSPGDTRDEQNIRGILTVIYRRTMPSGVLLSKLTELIPHLFMQFLVEIMRR